MRVQTLLRIVYPLKGFVYDDVEMEPPDGSGAAGPMYVRIRENSRIRGRCGQCGQPGPCYDHLPERPFEMVPVWGVPVLFLYARRRVQCPTCGVKAERLDWVASDNGKSRLTTAFAFFLGMWAKCLSWSQVAMRFATTWYAVRVGVEQLVAYGRAHQDLSGVTAIGVDEIAVGKGQNSYLTLVYQLNTNCRRLLWIGRDRTEETLGKFFNWLGEKRTQAVEFVCSDMWKPYLKVIRERVPQAKNILDRFHLMMNLNEAKDEIRRDEARRLEQAGRQPVLKKSRWCLLKRRENLTAKQATKLKELMSMNLRTMRAYLLVEDFHQFWDYTSAHWAGCFLDGWCRRVMRSRLEPLKKKARTLRRYRDLILNWFAAKGEFSSGMVEGMNNKAKTRVKMGYGYRTRDVLELALYHDLARLPVPDLAHRFFG
jgi:transposase